MKAIYKSLRVKTILCTFLMVLFSIASFAQAAFITVWDTSLGDEPFDYFKIPAFGSFDYLLEGIDDPSFVETGTVNLVFDSEFNVPTPGLYRLSMTPCR